MVSMYWSQADEFQYLQKAIITVMSEGMNMLMMDVLHFLLNLTQNPDTE